MITQRTMEIQKASIKYLGSIVHKRTLLFLLLALCLLLPAELRAAEPRGSVERAEPGFWAVRDGSRVDLAEGAAIYEFDILETDGSGAATLRFDDDSTLEMQGDTRIDIMEVVFSENRNRFNVGVVEGTARVVTGAIVRRNPRGYKITTPHSTIGIRGTTLIVTAAEKETTTFVESLSGAHTVEVRNRSTGDSVEVGRDNTTIGNTADLTMVDGLAVTVAGRVRAGISPAALKGVSVTTATGVVIGDPSVSTSSPEASQESGTTGGGNDGGGGSSSGSSGGNNGGGGNNAGDDCANDNSSPGRW